MNILQHVKYDITRIFKSPLGLLGLFLAIIPSIAVIIISLNMDNVFTSPDVLTGFFAFGGLVLLMFTLRTIVRDMSNGTIQLFLNSKKNRTMYLYGKLISVIGIIILFTILGTVVTLLSTFMMTTGDLEFTDFFKMFGELLIIILFYVTLLNIINLLTGKAVMVYTTAIVCIILLPTIFNILSIVPQIGEKIVKVMKYNPLDFLPDILNSGYLGMEGYQIGITVVCIIVFTVINHFVIINKNI